MGLKFLVAKSSDNTEREIEISTLEELVTFIKESKNPVIIDMDDPPRIEIYDDYRE